MHTSWLRPQLESIELAEDQSASVTGILHPINRAKVWFGSFTSFPPSRCVRFAPRADTRPMPAIMLVQGLIFAGGGLLGWWRRRQKIAEHQALSAHVGCGSQRLPKYLSAARGPAVLSRPRSGWYDWGQCQGTDWIGLC